MPSSFLAPKVPLQLTMLVPSTAALAEAAAQPVTATGVATPVEMTPIGATELRPKHWAPDRLTPSLNLVNVLALKQARLLRPDIVDFFHPPEPGTPRSQLTVPVCPDPGVRGQPERLFTLLLEEAANPQAKCYLPRCALAVHSVIINGQPTAQPWVILENDAQGGKLTVHLNSFADAALGDQSRTATALNRTPTVDLQFTRSGVQESRAFTEVTSGPDGLQAVLHVTALELPQLHHALTLERTRLIVRRTLDYAVQVGTQTAPPHEGMFAIVTATVEDKLDCWFPANYTHIFRDTPQDSNRNFDLILHTLQWKGQPHTYCQDPVRPERFLYLPDAFKIARLSEPPYKPMIKISASTKTVSMTYFAAPYTDARRLLDAARQAKQRGLTTAEPVFEPLVPIKGVFKVALPQANDTSGPLAERPNVSLDFRSGLWDTLVLPVADFRPVFDALFSQDSVDTLLRGQISLSLGEMPLPPIPFEARLNDLVGEVLAYEEAELPDEQHPCLGVKAKLTNKIESRVRLNHLSATLHRTKELSTEVTATLAGLALQVPQFPIELEPEQFAEFIVTPGGTVEGPLDAVFDLDGVKVLPNRDKVYEALIDPAVPPTYATSVTVSAPRAALRGPDVYAISVRFPGRGPLGEDLDVDLNADLVDEATGRADSTILNKTATLHAPLKGLLLHESDTNAYSYSVTLRRTSGDVVSESGTRTGTSFWPKTVAPAS